MPRARSKNGYDTTECVSALQKCIRRGDEEDALYWALELFESGFGNWVWKRLRIICSEDIGLAWPEGPAVIRSLWENYEYAMKEPNSGGSERLFLFHAVMALARAPKSRAVDNAVIYLSHHPELGRPIPDVARDIHTRNGKQQRRGVTHFFEEGTKLSPAGEVDDPYRDRAYKLCLEHPDEIGPPGGLPKPGKTEQSALDLEDAP